MNWLHHHIHHHAKKVVHHVRTHHKKYLLLGSVMAWFFAVTKVLVLFATSFALFSSSHNTSYADTLPIDAIPQDTGSVLMDTGSYYPDADVSLLADLSSTAESSSSDDLLDTGTLIALMAQSVADMLTWSESSGAQLSGLVSSGVVDSWILLSWNTNTVSNPNPSDENDAGTQYYENLLANQIVYCNTWDLIMTTVLSGQTFAGITSFQRTYSGWCISDDLSFQLYDHNHNWIEISTLSGSNLWFSFDSKFLYTWGWYSTTWLNASGQISIINSGLYLGVSTRFATWYKVRLLNKSWYVLYESSGFSIDNLAPTLTGFTFSYYTWDSDEGEVHFLFSGSEILDTIKISLSSGKASSKFVSGLSYDYYLRGFGTGFSGNIAYSITYSDIWGNTWMASGTWYLSFSGKTLTNTYTGSIFTEMKEELDKFNACKKDLKFKVISFDVGGNRLVLNMPAFKKTEVKKLIAAFSYFVIKKLDTVWSIDQNELNSITKVYDNFLVVLKLVSDDDNNCEQNLGNYYRWLFTTTLERYWITDL